MFKVTSSSPNHDRDVFPVTFFTTSTAYAAISDSVSKFELSCHPLDGLFDFNENRPATAKSDLGKDLARMI
jgi:hypothetical protein